ncbi:MAG: hypothetical protein Phyf2KO_10950 [Phycisphaerales bacterium]
MSIEIDKKHIEAARSHDFAPAAEPFQHSRCLREPKREEEDSKIRLMLDIQFKKIDGRRLLLSPDGDDLVLPSRPQPKQHIVEAIGLAYRWNDELVSSGEHIKPFTESRGIARTRIMKLLPLINLGPEILNHALAGTLAPSVTLEDLLEAAKHLDWTHQARSLGLDRVAATA